MGHHLRCQHLVAQWHADFDLGGFNGVPQFFPYGRDRGDTPDLTQTDLLIAHPFKIGNYSLEISMNVLNLFDENTVTRIGNNNNPGRTISATSSPAATTATPGTSSSWSLMTTTPSWRPAARPRIRPTANWRIRLPASSGFG